MLTGFITLSVVAIGFGTATLLGRSRRIPVSPGHAFRILHLHWYLRPLTHICKCGTVYPSGTLSCNSPTHDPQQLGNQDNGDLLSSERTRQWSLRITIGLALFGALQTPWPTPALFITLSILVAVLILPHLDSPVGRTAFAVSLLGAGGIIGLLGLSLFDQHPSLMAHSINWFAPTPRLGGMQLHLTTGSIPVGGALAMAFLLAALGAALPLSYAAMRDRDEHSSVARWQYVLAGGIASALAFAVTAAAFGYMDLARAAVFATVPVCGWFIGSVIAWAAPITAHRLAGKTYFQLFAGTIAAVQVPPIPPFRPRPIVLPRGAFGRTLGPIMRTLDMVGITLANACVRIGSALINLLLRLAVTALSWVLRQLTTVIQIAIHVADFVARCIWGGLCLAVHIFVFGMPAALAGTKATLLAPSLILASAGLTMAAALKLGLYLTAGRPQDFLLGMLFCVAALAGAAGWTIAMVGLDRIRGLLDAFPELAAQTILAMTVLLDIYGIERRVSGAHSHFGLASWLLNGIVIVVVGVVVTRNIGESRHDRVVSTIPVDSTNMLPVVEDWSVTDDEEKRSFFGMNVEPGTTVEAPVAGQVSIPTVRWGGLTGTTDVYPYIILREDNPDGRGREVVFRPGLLKELEVHVIDGQRVDRGASLFTVKSAGLSSWTRFFDPSSRDLVVVSESSQLDTTTEVPVRIEYLGTIRGDQTGESLGEAPHRAAKGHRR